MKNVQPLSGGLSQVLLALTFAAAFSADNRTLAQVAVQMSGADKWDVYSLEQDSSGRLWVAQNGSVYLIEGRQVKPFSANVPYVNSLSYLKGKVWLATRDGAYRLDDDKPVRVPLGECLVVRNVQLVGDDIWFATDKGAYPLATLQRTPDQVLDVNRIERINGEIWLATRTGLYRTDGKQLFRVGDETLNLSVHTVKTVDGKVLVGTERGLYAYDGRTLSLVSDNNLYVNDIDYVDGQIWLSTLKGPFLIESGRIKPLLTQEFDVKEIRKIRGKMWLAVGHSNSRGGLYTVDEDVAITIKPASSDSWWASFLKVFGDNVWPAGVIKPEVQYRSRTTNRDPYGSDVPRQFEVIVTSSKTEFERAVQAGQYSPAIDFERSLSSGRRTIYMSARDRWGNTFHAQPISVWIVPGPIILTILFWLLLIVLVLFLAPYNLFCQRLLMNPYVRKIGSLWLIPAIITMFPFVRRHLLRRYFREISKDEEFAQWKTRYVLPGGDFLPECISQRLREHRVLFLVGQSGIGKTSYFKYLVSHYCCNRRYLPKIVPVFLPLKLYEGVSVREVFSAQLAKYGQLTDAELNLFLLSQGDFLIFIDGLNEVKQDEIKKIASFVDGLKKLNFFFLSSQESYPVFRGLERVSLHTLDKKSIDKILRDRLGNQADAVIKIFYDELYKEYAIPQDLELAMDLIEKGRSLPLSKLELYEATLKPIFDSWREMNLDYEDRLCLRAYEMMLKRESFDKGDNPVPEEIRNRLEEDKLLIHRGGQYQFRHDLIRAYLAAKYFKPRWRQLLGGDVFPDSNWNPMIQFVTLDSNEANETKSLLFSLLNRNVAVARETFNWLESKHPRLIRDWSDAFDQEYGKAMRTAV